MKVVRTDLPGVLIFEPRVFGDHRGFFVETWRADVYRDAGLPDLVQDNHSRSAHGVLRGLHYQLVQPQGKLVRVARGRVYDVAVDVRRGSPSFGRWIGVELDDRAHRQLWVPAGFAHGFCVLSEEADFIYRCSDYYHPASERGIAWNDRDLAIDWPVAAPRLSDKDRANPRLTEVHPVDLPVYLEGAL